MIKDELKEIIDIDCRIESKLRQIERLRNKVNYAKSFDYTRDKIQSTKTNSQEDLIIKIVDLEHSINNDIDALVDRKEAVRTVVNNILGKKGTVLEMRYLESLNWDDIANRLNMSIQSVYRLHNEALEELNKAEVTVNG